MPALVLTCSVCGGPRTERNRSHRCSHCWGMHRRDSALVGPVRAYADDKVAQALVQHTGGATLEEVGEAMGLTRERVRQIEAEALDKLRRRARLAGLSVEDLARPHTSTGRHHAGAGHTESRPQPEPQEPVADGRPQSPALRDLDEQLERATRRLSAWIDVLDQIRSPMEAAS